MTCCSASRAAVTCGFVATAPDVTASFTRQPDGTLLGVVRGLRKGANTITASDRGKHASLRVVNHPRSGPVFSGPQQLPFYCQTEVFGLAPAQQPLCEAPTVVTLRVPVDRRPVQAARRPASQPADLAHRVRQRRAVPYIVRVETGVIDRAVYQLAALYDGTDPSPVRPEAGWNGGWSTTSAAAATAATGRAATPRACWTTCSCRRVTRSRRPR